MRPYIAVLTARIRMLLQYRTAALAGLSTQFFWGLIKVMTFEAFYRSTTAPQPMSFDQVVSYTLMALPEDAN
jgi:ABC-2 type transport system permease protein